MSTKDQFRKEFKSFLDQNSLTQAVVCRTIGVAPAQISTFLKGGYISFKSTIILQGII
jgi:predicted XRE-type DNA-binding protein